MLYVSFYIGCTWTVGSMPLGKNMLHIALYRVILRDPNTGWFKSPRAHVRTVSVGSGKWPKRFCANTRPRWRTWVVCATYKSRAATRNNTCSYKCTRTFESPCEKFWNQELEQFFIRSKLLQYAPYLARWNTKNYVSSRYAEIMYSNRCFAIWKGIK